MHISIARKIKLSPVRILSIGFALLILLGAILLTFPISSADGTWTPFLDCLFTSTSATCVTGLVTLDTGSHWNYFGKTVIIFLIEIGGLGFMSFATLFALILGKKITLRERLIMQEAMNTFDLQGLVKLGKYILIFTFAVEGIGALFLSTQFIPEFGFARGIYYSIWHSVSAFCNAGFDLFGETSDKFISIVGWQRNPVVVMTLGVLIAIGGLGFSVWADIYNYKNMKSLSLHSKIVITITLFLIFGGAVIIYIIEHNNSATIGNMSLVDKFTNSLFAAVTPRTAGMNSIPTAEMMPTSRFFTMVLMFIGGSPGSTAGGIKTSTLGIIIMAIICTVKGKEDTEIYKRRISKDLVLKAFTIATIGLLVVASATMILTVTERKMGFSLEFLLYEATSAFATVGLTLGVTPFLSSLGKVLIILCMYVGRVGPLTIALSLAQNKKKSAIRYPEDKILVG
ncbi:TrkH family potassium uptake protein [Clostridium thermarum]|uniref:TrkH family potassium uptake protein n=1 Tax=Clostridium thermarum TaxID=1716543 RepID=UPI001121C692|nr:TrkH family potassium uptake protein [Clostridium thermarum]